MWATTVIKMLKQKWGWGEVEAQPLGATHTLPPGAPAAAAGRALQGL